MKLSYITMPLVSILFSCGSHENQDESATTETSQQTETTETAEKPVVENSFMLESGSAGIFRIGQKFPDLPEALKNRNSTIQVANADGSKTEHLQHVVFNSLEDVIEINMQKNDAVADEDLLITDMRIISDYYETKDGLKVGMSISDLFEKYPDSKVNYYGSSGEVYAEIPSLINLKFVFDPADCNKKLNGSKDIHLSKSNFKEDAKIVYIRVL